MNLAPSGPYRELSGGEVAPCEQSESGQAEGMHTV